MRLCSSVPDGHLEWVCLHTVTPHVCVQTEGFEKLLLELLPHRDPEWSPRASSLVTCSLSSWPSGKGTPSALGCEMFLLLSFLGLDSPGCVPVSESCLQHCCSAPRVVSLA